MSEELFEVEKIIGRKEENGVVKYKVKWLNHPESQCTWEPLENLEGLNSEIEAYETTLKPSKRKIQSHSESQESEDYQEDDSDSVDEKVAKRHLGQKTKRKNLSKKKFHTTPKEEINIKEGDNNLSVDEEEKDGIESEEQPKKKINRGHTKMIRTRKTARRNNSEIKTDIQNDQISNLRRSTNLKSSLVKSPMQKIKQSNDYKESSKSNKKSFDSNSKSNISQSADEGSRPGNIKRDVPKKVLYAKPSKDGHNVIHCQVLWQQKAGVTLTNSMVTNEELIETYPEVLCKYYESRLVFPITLKK